MDGLARCCRLLSFAINLHWQTEILLFAVFARRRCGVGRLARNRQGATSNRFSPAHDAWSAGCSRGEAFRTVRDVRIDDTIWRVNGPDAPAGRRVRIVKAEARR